MASSAEATGAVLIGLVFAIWLSSSAVHLASSYVGGTVDPYSWTAGVVFLVVLNTAHTAVLCYSSYDRLIEHFGEEDYLQITGWPHMAHLSIALTLALLTHVYFLLRISLFFSTASTRARRTILGSIGFFATGQVAFGVAGIYYTATTGAVRLFEARLGEREGWLMLASGLCAVLCNAVIFVATFRGTCTAKNALQDETIIELFSRLIVETNLIPAVLSILALAFYLARDTQGYRSGVSTAISIVLPKLYVISLLSSIKRGIEPAPEGPIARMMKHASSLSDMFKGTPVSRTLAGRVTVSKIGTPREFVATPIADMYGGGAKASEEDPGWLRRTFGAPDSGLTAQQQQDGLAVPLQRFAPSSKSGEGRPVTALSISDYGDYFLDDTKTNPSNAHADSGSAEEHGQSTSIDVHSQTPTPRRANFGRDAEVVLNGPVMDVGSAANGAIGNTGATLAGRQPVRYGYL
ncbi:hypothetical protein JCM11251_001446 [Rhodosporidiobolus azoricus]